MEQVFQACVLEQKSKGKSVFLSSHIMSEVERLCDRIGIIRDGKLVQTGTLDDLRHLTRYHMDLVTMREPQGIENVTGIHNILVEHNNIRFEVDTKEMDAVIRFVSQFGIQKLESAPLSLEDLFMRHYDTSVGGKIS
jgi:ABC-2 type transport system ATP-binding protein